MRKFKSPCGACKAPWIPDARHIDTDGIVKDCFPSDNLEYLEYMYDKNLAKISRS